MKVFLTSLLFVFLAPKAFAQNENLVDSLAKAFCRNLKANHRTSRLIPQDYPFFENKLFFTTSNHSFKQLWSELGYSFNAKYEAEAIVLREVLKSCPNYVNNIAGRRTEKLEYKKIITYLNEFACVCLKDSIFFSQKNYKNKKSLNRLFELYSDCLLNKIHNTTIDTVFKKIISKDIQQPELFEGLAADLVMTCPEVQDEIVEMIVLSNYENTDKLRVEKQEIIINEIVNFAHTGITTDSLYHHFISKQSFLIGEAIIKRAMSYIKGFDSIRWMDVSHISTRSILVFSTNESNVKLLGQFDIRFDQFEFDKVSFIRFVRPDNIENKDLFLLRAKEYIKEKK